MSPLVSVLMLSYNHAPYLPAAIESVLSQTLEDFELVVLEDGSRDGSLEIVQRYSESDPRVRLLTHEGHVNRGIGAGVNVVWPAARGRYAIGLPSDDMFYPDTLEREVAFLEAHPEVGYVYGYAQLVDAEGRTIEVPGPNGPQPRTLGADLTDGGCVVERLIQWNGVAGMTAMFRRECIEQTGVEPPHLLYGDWDRNTRAASHWEVAFIPRPLAICRVHGANTSRGVERAERIARQLDVTAHLRVCAPGVGGRLAEPRMRALLELQMGYLRFAAGERGAEADVCAAFERDPALANDARWLGDWLWSRPLDELLLARGPEFVAWFEATVRPLLEPAAARTMRREARAARAEARAVRLARAGRPLSTIASGAAALALSPRRIHDRRLTGVVLDSVLGTRVGRALRRAKHRLLAAAAR